VDKNELWRHIHAERAVLAEALAGISEAEWDHDSLCTGWTVKDVAAHVISNPQLGLRDVVAMGLRNPGRGYNAIIFREVKRLGSRQTPAGVLADFATYATATRHVPVTTTVEPLVDSLVHTQDILRPLGLRHDMPPDAAAVAADRVRLLGALAGWRRPRVRLVASDVDWVRGRGPTVEGPMQELLMLSSGRAPDTSLLEGEGLSLLTST
jgi:uncharacterized protein (TIGR03083 family)